MILALFVFIAWVTICIFFLIPKTLSLIENIIAYFTLTIIVININTILDLNLNLTQHSRKPELFLSLLVNRNILIPLCLVIFANLAGFQQKLSNKIIAAVVTVFVLCLDELLILWTGTKTFTGWNWYMDIVKLSVQVALSAFVAVGIKRLPSSEVKH